MTILTQSYPRQKLSGNEGLKRKQGYQRTYYYY